MNFISEDIRTQCTGLSQMMKHKSLRVRITVKNVGIGHLSWLNVLTKVMSSTCLTLGLSAIDQSVPPHFHSGVKIVLFRFSGNSDMAGNGLESLTGGYIGSAPPGSLSVSLSSVGSSPRLS